LGERLRVVARSVTLRRIHALYLSVYCVRNDKTVCSASLR
jgi:hypothetical protein